MVNITINGMNVSVPEGSTILQAAQKVGIHIPTLCYHPDQSIKANCRVCVCEVEGNRLLQAACSTPVFEGMVIKTNTPKVLEARKTIVELILANHPQDCLNCIRNGACELQSLAEELIIRDNPFEIMVRGYEKDLSTPSLSGILTNVYSAAAALKPAPWYRASTRWALKAVAAMPW
jgi:NADH-quinone oxidoreductase subunit G